MRNKLTVILNSYFQNISRHANLTLSDKRFYKVKGHSLDGKN